MLVLLPPSEGKAAPVRGAPLDLERLSFPALTSARRRVVDTLVALCTDDPGSAVRALGLGPEQSADVATNSQLLHRPTARADRIYAGVLYEALDLKGLDEASRRRAARILVIASGLFGLVRLTDRIPAYRCPGGASLPTLGPLARVWRAVYPQVPELADTALLFDLRSGTYAAFWRPEAQRSGRIATARVLLERDGRRSVVSHVNKATKGRLVRSLLVSGASPRTAGQLTAVLRDLGWRIEQEQDRLDVIVTEL